MSKRKAALGDLLPAPLNGELNQTKSDYLPPPVPCADFGAIPMTELMAGTGSGRFSAKISFTSMVAGMPPLLAGSVALVGDFTDSFPFRFEFIVGIPVAVSTGQTSRMIGPLSAVNLVVETVSDVGMVPVTPVWLPAMMPLSQKAGTERRRSLALLNWAKRR